MTSPLSKESWIKAIDSSNIGLIMSYAKKHRVDSYNNFPIKHAIESELFDIASLLISYKADINENRDMLTDAVNNGKSDTVSFLIQNNFSTHNVRELLISATSKGFYDILVMLCEITRITDNNLLYIAIESGHGDIITFLSDKGLSITLQKDKDDLLCKTASKGHLASVEYLIKNGAIATAYNS